MALFVACLSGTTCTSGFVLERTSKPFAIGLAVSFTAAQLTVGFSPVALADATSASFGTLARGDGTGAAFIATSGAGPLWSTPIQAVTPWARLQFSTAPTITTTATIVPVLS